MCHGEQPAKSIRPLLTTRPPPADARKRGTNRPFSALLCLVWLGVLAPAQSAAPALFGLRRRYFVAHQPPGPANPHAGFPRRVLGQRTAGHCEQFAGELDDWHSSWSGQGPPLNLLWRPLALTPVGSHILMPALACAPHPPRAPFSEGD